MEQVLDALHEVAALEHTHLVYHLRLHYAVGGDPQEQGDERPAAVQEAARATSFNAQSDMFHLKNVNGVLVRAGREPVLDRVAQVSSDGGPAIDLHPMTPGA